MFCKQKKSLSGLRQLYRENVEGRTRLRTIQALAFVSVQNIYSYFLYAIADLRALVNNVETDGMFIPFYSLFLKILDLIMYFVKTYIGPEIINNMPVAPPNMGPQCQAVDAFVRQRIVIEHLELRPALFPMEIWCVSGLLNNNLCRTNNSVEGHHRSWNALFPHPHPKVSAVIKKVFEEDERWRLITEEFNAAPAHGIRGHPWGRKEKYIQQDDNLRILFQQHQNEVAAGNANIINYLRNVSHQLADYEI